MAGSKPPPAPASLQIHGFMEQETPGDPLYYYGSDGPFINNIIPETENEWISKKLNIRRSQVIWAIRKEMARTVEDVLSRRTRGLLLDAKESMRIVAIVAGIMAKEMNKDENWIEDQVKSYKEVARNYVLEPGE